MSLYTEIRKAALDFDEVRFPRLDEGGQTPPFLRRFQGRLLSLGQCDLLITPVGDPDERMKNRGQDFPFVEIFRKFLIGLMDIL